MSIGPPPISNPITPTAGDYVPTVWSAWFLQLARGHDDGSGATDTLATITAADNPGARTINPATRQQSTEIDTTVTLTNGNYPQNVTFWKSTDDGVSFVGIGWFVIEGADTVFKCGGIVPELAQNWRMAACAGMIGTEPVAIPAAALPTGTLISDSIHVVGVSLPGSGDVPGLDISDGNGTAFPYDQIRSDYSHYWSIREIAYDDTASVADQAAFFIRLTVQACDASHATIGPEVPFAGTYPSSSGAYQTFGPLMGDYGNRGNGGTYSGNIAYVRFRIYSCNRIDATNDSFANPAAATLQMAIGGGAGYLDVLVATGGLAPGVTSITSADNPSTRTINLDTRQQSTTVESTVTVTGGLYPQYVTFWRSLDDGANFVGIGWQLVQSSSQICPFGMIVPELAQHWRVAACAGTIAVQPGVSIPAASLPPGSIISASITVTGVSLPSATAISALTVPAGTSGDASYPYNMVRPENGTQYWSIPYCSYDDSVAVTDQASFFIRITVQAVGASHTAVGPEVPYGGTYPSNTGMVQKFPHLDGDYGDKGNGVAYTGNIAYVRFRVYSCNRIDPTNDSFSNVTAATLQTGIGGGLGYLDVLVATGGGLPSGKMLLGRYDPASLPANVTLGTLSAQYGSPDLYGNVPLQVKIPYTVPGGWTGTAVHCWYEYPDQSASAAVLRLDGTTPLGTSALVGEWMPQDGGKTAYDSTSNSHYVLISTLLAPADPTDLRVQLVGCNDVLDPKPVRATVTGATPSAVITLQAPVIGARGTGQEFAGNLHAFSATAQPAKDFGDGKLQTPVDLTFTLPMIDVKARGGGVSQRVDTRLARIRFESVADDPLVPHDVQNIPVGSLTEGSYTLKLPTTAALTTITIYAYSCDSKGNVNNFVPGVTPQDQITIGSLDGTISLAKARLSEMDSYFRVSQAGLFGIDDEGIGPDLIAQLAISAKHLSNTPMIDGIHVKNGAIDTLHVKVGAITNALIHDLLADKITGGTITASISITAPAIHGGTMDASIITGSTVTLDLHGVITTLGNLLNDDDIIGLETKGSGHARCAISIQNPGGVTLNSGGVLVLNSYGGAGIILLDTTGNFGSGMLALSSGNPACTFNLTNDGSIYAYGGFTTGASSPISVIDADRTFHPQHLILPAMGLGSIAGNLKVGELAVVLNGSTYQLMFRLDSTHVQYVNLNAASG